MSKLVDNDSENEHHDDDYVIVQLPYNFSRPNNCRTQLND
jgi:hypothetical protein